MALAPLPWLGSGEPPPGPGTKIASGARAARAAPTSRDPGDVIRADELRPRAVAFTLGGAPVFPFESAGEAHRRISSRANVGKVVLVP